MNREAVSGIMLTLLLTSMLTVVFTIQPILADADTAELLDEPFWVQKADGNNSSNLTNFQDSFLSKGFNWKTSAKEDPRSYSVNEDRWNFNRTNEWADFAKVDGDSAELVIGVNNGNPNSYTDITGLIGKKGGNVVNTVSMGGEIRAVVADVPLAAISSFVTEVRATGLSYYIEPNMKVQAQLVPNDPYWSLQWGPQKIEADWAWNTTVGDPSVLVAVVDTGIDYTHPDLATNYAPLGYDWVNMDPDPLDDCGHGTHCAGIIAAVLNNGVGIAGLAQARVMAEKVLDSWGGGYWDWVANGIINATDCGADIISMSLGDYGDSELLHEAVRYAYDAGVLVIAATGNDNTNMKLYPAGYNEVVAVAATDQSDYKASFSNWGDWIELSAPGVDIYSTLPTYYVTLNGFPYYKALNYDYLSGTSMACPHVAGVAALVWSRYPSKTRDWVRSWLRYTADDLGDSGFDVYYGYGRINARKAVEQTPPEHELIACEWRTPPYVEPGASAIINATILNFGENDETDITVRLLVNSIIVDSRLISFLFSGSSTAVSLTWNPIVEGLYNVTLYVVPVPGEISVENNVVWEYVYVGFPVKAVVLHSAGNIYGDIITNWQVLNNEWHQFGDTMVYIDYTTLNKDNITYEDIASTEADVLIISCAYDAWMGWQFTDSEIEAIKLYVHEGHGLIATAGTLYYGVPNNNKLAPLFGLNETVTWSSTGTDLLHMLNVTHPLFRKIQNPFVFKSVGTSVPSDRRWDSNELIDGKYLAVGHYQESAIIVRRGLVYVSPWLEVIPPYYHHHLQLLYNAITWSRYQKPRHELIVSVEAPAHLNPGESTQLNATVYNLGGNNETNVELQLLIDGLLVDSVTVPELLIDSSYTLSYPWTPLQGMYNVTAYAPQVPDEEYTRNNIASVNVWVRYVIAQVAVLNSLERPPYFTGGWSNDYQTLVDALNAQGFHAQAVTNEEIIGGTLSFFDVFVMVDNVPNDAAVPCVVNFWSNEGGIVAFDSSICFLCYAGILPPESAGSNGYYFYWDYETSYQARIAAEHPITEGYEVGQIIYGTSGDAEYRVDVLAGTSAYPYYTMLVEDVARPSRAYASAYEPLMAGKVVHIWDAYHWSNIDLQLMILNTMEWAAALKYEHDLAATLEVPKILGCGESTLVNATVWNWGLSNETDVELQLLINDTVVDSVVISELPSRASHTLSYLWTPSIAGVYYNVTAYASHVLGEVHTSNNQATGMVYISFYKRTYLSHEWINGGTPMGWQADDSSWPYTLPFDFPFYGSYYGIIYISSNGLITFIGSDSSCSNSISELAGKLAIAPAWDDWRTDQRLGDDIYIWQPDLDHVIIRWQVVAYYDTSIFANFEAILGSDGVIQFNYEQNNGPISATVGISNGAGEIIAEDVTDLNYINTILFTPFRPEHDLEVRLEAPTSLALGRSTILNATVKNLGTNNETSVELQLLINGTIVDLDIIPELLTGSSHTFSYSWTPADEGLYNVTTYAPPVPDETFTVNNLATEMVYVLVAQVHNVDTGLDYLTIQEAIDAPETLDGHTIFVEAGTYFENILVDKTLTLIGENKESTIVDGNNYGHVIDLKANSICVSGFTFQNGVSGIFADHTHSHTIENNIVQNNCDGIYLYGSLFNKLNDNLMTRNNFGFRIDESYYNTLRRNEMRDNIVYNFYFDLWGIIYNEHFIQDIDTSNTVDGKPIYWWIYQSSKQVPTDAGFVVLFGSYQISIKDLELTKNNHGIVFLGTSSSNIENVTIHGCETGIALHVSGFNKIQGNRATNNGNGIILEQSLLNDVGGNHIESNGYGIITWEADYNRIYHNNFINNTIQVYNQEPYYSINYWDDGYPSGGNYWSDYSARYPSVGDEYQGENQDILGSDGIWDLPYVIDADNQDNYPLVEPWTPVTHDVAVYSVVPSATEVYVGWKLNITLVVKNEGDATETFTVTCKYILEGVEHTIGTQNVTDLAPNANTTLTFTWTTTDVTVHTLKAEIPRLVGETDTADNTITDGIVKVYMTGDVNKDWKINIKDIAIAAFAFGSYPGHPRWNPIADVNQDNKVNMRDIAIIAGNFGKTL